MNKFALIGDPIVTSLSPALFKRAYGGKFEYNLVETPDFETAWAAFLSDYKAINVTMPFKTLAYERADIVSEEAKRCEASNLCVKTPDGIVAYNSDYLGVRHLLNSLIANNLTAAIIGYGGAGKAALCAAEDCGFKTTLYRHHEISLGLQADVVIYTLPSAVDGIHKIKCQHLIEANYKNPSLKQRDGWIENYIPGTSWHLWQAILGYKIMTGESPNIEEMKRFYE